MVHTLLFTWSLTVSNADNQEISDNDIKSKLSELWAKSPETRFAGVTELRNLIHQNNPEWPISEKRLRRLRTEAQMDETARNPHVVQSKDGERYSTGLHIAPGEMTQDIIGEDGVERTYLLGIGICTLTGRKFKKDEGTGEWVLQ
jgi:hypothetical protein